jgi:hypothetical protein
VAEFERNFNRVDTYNAVKNLLEGPILAAQAVIGHVSTRGMDYSQGRSAAQ